MDKWTRFYHFVGAIKQSIAGLITSVFLFGMCCMLIIAFPTNCTQIISFLVGVIASIIASVVFNVTSKYVQSCSIFIWILDQTEIFTTYVETTYVDMLSNEQYRFELWRYVVEIREKARQLTFTKDFDDLSSHFSDVIEATNSKNKESIRKALDELIAAKCEITEPKSPIMVYFLGQSK